ncbi:MAG: DUF2807 domain-containing protein [Dehalococcoidales bacterium]|nr:DUF2807 domain-containing protein [Dehalococcoidales bacterium]
MKKSIVAIAVTVLLIAAVLLSGCSAAIIKKEAGPVGTRDYDYTDFTVVEVGHAFSVEITPAETYRISISAGENAFDHIEVTKTGGKLEIGMDTFFFHFLRSPRVKITMPRLTGLHLTGATEGNVTGFSSSDDFDLSLSGASELYMELETGNFEGELSGASELTGNLVATSCEFTLSGASEMELTGSGGDIKIDASGASQADLEHFNANDADIDFSGASDGNLNVNGRLDISLSGASLLEYSGSPTLGELDLSGGSELKNRED